MRAGWWSAGGGLVLLLVVGCGDEGASCPAANGHCITAHFSFSDGKAFYFGGEAKQSAVSSLGSITATDPVEPYTVSIHWSQAKVTGPGQHTPNVTGGAVQLYITRPHPTNPNKYRTSNTRYGTLTFSNLGKSKGDVTSGTFEGIRLIRDNPDDKIDLTLSEGTFSAVMQ